LEIAKKDWNEQIQKKTKPDETGVIAADDSSKMTSSVSAKPKKKISSSNQNIMNTSLKSTFKRSISSQKGKSMGSTFSAFRGGVGKRDDLDDGIVVMNRNIQINSTKVKNRSPTRENYNLSTVNTRSNHFEDMSFRPVDTIKSIEM
jgi:hypothetical protein